MGSSPDAADTAVITCGDSARALSLSRARAGLFRNEQMSLRARVQVQNNVQHQMFNVQWSVLTLPAHPLRTHEETQSFERRTVVAVADRRRQLLLFHGSTIPDRCRRLLTSNRLVVAIDVLSDRRVVRLDVHARVRARQTLEPSPWRRPVVALDACGRFSRPLAQFSARTGACAHIAARSRAGDGRNGVGWRPVPAAHGARGRRCGYGVRLALPRAVSTA
jgi:hypothetical protein